MSSGPTYYPLSRPSVSQLALSLFLDFTFHQYTEASVEEKYLAGFVAVAQFQPTAKSVLLPGGRTAYQGAEICSANIKVMQPKKKDAEFNSFTDVRGSSPTAKGPFPMVTT
ncbi:hypothetical protein JOB18_003402 [Solea senegalensis]|uniref:Uncharacterized protein n=1 Tax=Solea senegalensis TaxID=28829 RepID=A0AAV6SWQ1_SOLSE|nr:hypothetical protein JOB18_003402 [Solea senegalensis]